MNEQSRLFDFLYYQLEKFPKDDMLAAKEDGQWNKYSTASVVETINNVSAGLLQLGLSGNDMNVEKQDKIAVISRNRPEWLILDMACQQIGAILCPIYPTTNINELEFIFNDAAIQYVFLSGKDILEKVNHVRANVSTIKNVYSFDEIAGVDYWKKITATTTADGFEKLNQVKSAITPEHCATIIYTSGTTGTPKG